MRAQRSHFVKNGVFTKRFTFYTTVKTIHNQAKYVLMDYHDQEATYVSKARRSANLTEGTRKFLSYGATFSSFVVGLS